MGKSSWVLGRAEFDLGLVSGEIIRSVERRVEWAWDLASALAVATVVQHSRSLGGTSHAKQACYVFGCLLLAVDVSSICIPALSHPCCPIRLRPRRSRSDILRSLRLPAQLILPEDLQDRLAPALATFEQTRSNDDLIPEDVLRTR